MLRILIQLSTILAHKLFYSNRTCRIKKCASNFHSKLTYKKIIKIINQKCEKSHILLCNANSYKGSMKMAESYLGFWNWMCYYLVDNLSILNLICWYHQTYKDKTVGPAFFIAISKKKISPSVESTIPIYRLDLEGSYSLLFSLMYRLSKNSYFK